MLILWERNSYKGDIINLGTYSDKETAIKVRKEYKENLHIYG